MQSANDYKVVGIVSEEIDSFAKPIHIVPESKDVGISGWHYNQPDLVRAIILALNSQFKDGPKDASGRRKIYINDVQFIADVAKKNLDIDLKHWLFVPEDVDYLYQALLFKHDFFYWAKSNYYNELQDRLLDDFVEFGTCVQKTLKGEVTRVPISKISITQSADSILDAVMSGGFFIEHHEMSVHGLKEYKGWKTDVYDNHEGKVYIAERYGYVHRSDLQKFKGEEGVADAKDMVLAMTILGTTDEKGDPEFVHYMEEVTEEDIKKRYQEGWFQKVDGRWLGRGPVEQVLENQIAKNITANMRLRSLEWLAKRVFQSASIATKNNLATQVRDGDVLEISPNGQISQVDMQTQGLQDFQQMDIMVDENREKKTFTFEAATGESLPSGTAFRLGLIQQNSVNKHYQKKQETFAAFLKRGYFEQLVPKFKKENKEHTLAVMFGADGVAELRQAYVTVRANRKVMNAAKNLKYLPFAEAEAEVLQELSQEPFMMFQVRKDAYKDVRLYVDLVITGETKDIPEEITSLTSLYQSLAPTNPQAAQEVLKEIFAMKGKDLSRLMGGAAQQQPPQPGAAPQGANFAPAPTNNAPTV